MLKEAILRLTNCANAKYFATHDEHPTTRAHDELPSPEEESAFPVFSNQELPPAVIERIADRFRLLSDPSRLRLVNALHVDGELSVGELVEHAGVTYGAVSKQLALLRSHGVLARRREGTRIYYRIIDPSHVRSVRRRVQGHPRRLGTLGGSARTGPGPLIRPVGREERASDG